jgi:hypothetical protein
VVIELNTLRALQEHGYRLGAAEWDALVWGARGLSISRERVPLAGFDFSVIGVQPNSLDFLTAIKMQITCRALEFLSAVVLFNLILPTV